MRERVIKLLRPPKIKATFFMSLIKFNLWPKLHILGKAEKILALLSLTRSFKVSRSYIVIILIAIWLQR